MWKFFYWNIWNNVKKILYTTFMLSKNFFAIAERALFFMDMYLRRAVLHRSYINSLSSFCWSIKYFSFTCLFTTFQLHFKLRKIWFNASRTFWSTERWMWVSGHRQLSLFYFCYLHSWLINRQEISWNRDKLRQAFVRLLRTNAPCKSLVQTHSEASCIVHWKRLSYVFFRFHMGR